MSWFKSESNDFFKRIEAENKKIEAENNRLRIIKEKEEERLRIIREKEEEERRKSEHIFREKTPDYNRFIMKDPKKYIIISRPDFRHLNQHNQNSNLKSNEFFKVKLETIRKINVLCPNLNNNQSLTVDIDIKAIAVSPSNEKINRFDIYWSIIGLSSTESQITVWLREKRNEKARKQWVKGVEKNKKEEEKWKKEHPYDHCCNNDYDDTYYYSCLMYPDPDDD